jgi:cellulose synthase/poly-beta-1,6-N-acetylglucosamine synthase-like glycosyltransferase
MNAFELVAMVVGTTAALLSLPGSLDLLLLTGGALLPRRWKAASAETFPDTYRVAVIVPAHNEEQSLPKCLRSLRAAQKHWPTSDVIVVADNCTDRTAAQASSGGARALVRNNLEQRGKGYALDFAFQTLLPEGYDAFLVVDADTVVSENFISESAAALQRGADAVQCGYLPANPDASVRTRLMRIALLAFNILRPQGRERLGLSCGIYGNGFGLRSRTLRCVPYEAASVVEDLEYHLSLVRAGLRVRFVEAASVYGEMPVEGRGVESQRARWEGGRLHMLRQQVPRLLLEVLCGRLTAVEPLLDLLLLPLALHICLLAFALLSPLPSVRIYCLVAFVIVTLHLLTAIAFGGRWRDLAVLAAAPFYVLWKIRLMGRIFQSSRNKARWIRTERIAEHRQL